MYVCVYVLNSLQRLVTRITVLLDAAMAEAKGEAVVQPQTHLSKSLTAALDKKRKSAQG